MSQFDVNNSLNAPATSLAEKNTPAIDSQHSQHVHTDYLLEAHSTHWAPLRGNIFLFAMQEINFVIRSISGFKSLNIIFVAVVYILHIGVNTLFV